MKRLFNTIFVLLIVVLFTSCADAVDVVYVDEPYGFFSGIWHGLIIWFSFIGSLFSDDIAIYAVNNTGGWYDFGFLIGLGGLIFGSSSNTSSRN